MSLYTSIVEFAASAHILILNYRKLCWKSSFTKLGFGQAKGVQGAAKLRKYTVDLHDWPRFKLSANRQWCDSQLGGIANLRSP